MLEIPTFWLQLYIDCQPYIRLLKFYFFRDRDKSRFKAILSEKCDNLHCFWLKTTAGRNDRSAKCLGDKPPERVCFERVDSNFKNN